MLQLLEVRCCRHANPPPPPLPLPHMHVNLMYVSHSGDAYALPVQLDFAIVVVSVVVLALDSLLPGVQWLKGLRVLRALKPLRSVCAFRQSITGRAATYQFDAVLLLGSITCLVTTSNMLQRVGARHRQ